MSWILKNYSCDISSDKTFFKILNKQCRNKRYLIWKPWWFSLGKNKSIYIFLKPNNQKPKKKKESVVVRQSEVSSKKGLKNTTPLFWAYVRQPEDHIGWGTLLPYPSINSTNPRTNPWHFREKILRIGRALKWHFWVFC